MIAGYPVRVWVGILSIVAFSLLSTRLALWKAFDELPSTPTQDEISRFDARFWRARSALPRNGVIGYVAESGGLGRSADFKYLKDFYLTEYALAPLIVRDSTEPTIVIGNFREVGPELKVADPTLSLVTDFGDGVFMLGHRPR
jgi:hypothetical protein